MTTPKKNPPNSTTRLYRRTKAKKQPAQPRRRPIAGLLQPGEVRSIALEPPLGDAEQAVLLTPNVGDVVLQPGSVDHVVVANQTGRIAAYLVTTAPRALVKLAAVPWAQVFGDVGEAVAESGVVERVRQLFAGVRAVTGR